MLVWDHFLLVVASDFGIGWLAQTLPGKKVYLSQTTNFYWDFFFKPFSLSLTFMIQVVLWLASNISYLMNLPFLINLSHRQSEYSLGIGDRKILCLLCRILWLIFDSLWQFLFRHGNSFRIFLCNVTPLSCY